MKQYPLVSIILPAYNAQAYVQLAIKSIIDQTYPNWELYVCDDCSTDNTYAIINKISKEDRRVRVFRNDTNLKLLKTRNKLLSIVNGDLITFQDADDYSHKFRLEKMVNEFKANPRLGLVSTQVAYVDAKGRLLRTSDKPTDYTTTLNLMYKKNVVGGSIMMLKREAIECVGGGFRQYLDGLSYQDYDMALLVAQKYECYSLPEVLYYYRQHQKSVSKSISVNRILAKDVVIHLAKQRREKGFDDIMDGHPAKVHALFESLRKPYIKDSSLIFREYAANFMFNKLYWAAITTAWHATRKRPFLWVNWRTLQYCVRKSIGGLLTR